MGTWQESKYDPEYNQIAIDILSTGKSLAAVCARLSVCRDTLYEWRDRHPEFAKSLKIGIQKSQVIWEDIGERGIKGEIDKFSATPWMFTMKNRFREDYKEDKAEPTLNESLVEKLIDRLVE